MQKLLNMSGFFNKKSFNMRFFASKFFAVLMCLCMFVAGIINPVALKNTETFSCSKTAQAALPSFQKIIKSLLKKEEKKPPEKDKIFVYLGGYPLGFTINCSGVLVVAISNDSAENLKEGDIITHIEGTGVSSSAQISKLLNSDGFKQGKVSLSITRDGKSETGSIVPQIDSVTGKKKLGIWIRDNSAGVGTMTYIRKDNFRFGALGHPVCDIDTGSIMPAANGNIFKCNIVGYKRGEKGSPGELRGLFLRNGSILGSLDKNNEFGVYGNFYEKHLDKYDDNLVEVADKSEVKSGKAQIRCAIDGCDPVYYDIEIVKTYFQSSKSNKSMFIRVTDKRLLETTGGIIQGMSGSPIIQNGKLVGAVTHVFVSDPTKGYGVYADWMIDN